MNHKRKRDEYENIELNDDFEYIENDLYEDNDPSEDVVDNLIGE